MVRHLFALCPLLGTVLIGALPLSAQVRPELDEVWQVQAVEFARSEGVRETRLVRGTAPGSRVDMSWYFFVARRGERVVLIDAGSDALSRPGRSALRARWSVTRAVSVTRALAEIDVAPGQVTDIVITHHHWDHVDGIANFPRATVHVQRAEWARIPARLRRPIEAQGRLRLLTADAHELFAGLRVNVAGRHTERQSMVEIDCANRTICIASDAAYLYRNIENELPSAVTLNAQHNVREVQARVRELGAENVIPGHDAAVFDRFRGPREHVADICR